MKLESILELRKIFVPVFQNDKRSTSCVMENVEWVQVTFNL